MNKAFSVPPPALGRHLLVDFWEAGQLVDPAPLRPVLEQAAQSAGAVVLEVKLHDFGDRAGFTGVALLAESHISIHTWPEHGYAAIDVFMCGDCDPMASINVLRRYFAPRHEDLQELKRGTLITSKP
ncbi:adenosylmethionine decarboxylase [Pelagimonas varians]|uniref:S-adenosylmethionine decarboxylase proenzyme n=1 Tax=Pelagimonas varians TaxID=696760 RepID=A0A238JYG9_9RHOB|nr:adenosylmethionine decarboxylase [Pelagimonas varians]PYG33053.1 S-adenosylmethionine decarboxylase [Pelagimonas varians]SMX35543.1 S-adenosylmethionine decarboxylase proenzyme precursor [Pelagimonas varians]